MITLWLGSRGRKNYRSCQEFAGGTVYRGPCANNPVVYEDENYLVGSNSGYGYGAVSYPGNSPQSAPIRYNYGDSTCKFGLYFNRSFNRFDNCESLSC